MGLGRKRSSLFGLQGRTLLGGFNKALTMFELGQLNGEGAAVFS